MHDTGRIFETRILNILAPYQDPNSGPNCLNVWMGLQKPILFLRTPTTHGRGWNKYLSRESRASDSTSPTVSTALLSRVRS